MLLCLWVCFCFVRALVSFFLGPTHACIYLTECDHLWVHADSIIAFFLMTEPYSIVNMYHVFFIHFFCQ